MIPNSNFMVPNGGTGGGGGGGIVVNTTPIGGGSDKCILFDKAGKVSEDVGLVWDYTNQKLVTTGAIQVADDPYDATTWDGNLTVPTKNAVRDKIEALSLANGLPTGSVGQVQYTNGASSFLAAANLVVDVGGSVQITKFANAAFDTSPNSVLTYTNDGTTWCANQVSLNNGWGSLEIAMVAGSNPYDNSVAVNNNTITGGLLWTVADGTGGPFNRKPGPYILTNTLTTPAQRLRMGVYINNSFGSGQRDSITIDPSGIAHIKYALQIDTPGSNIPWELGSDHTYGGSGPWGIYFWDSVNDRQIDMLADITATWLEHSSIGVFSWTDHFKYGGQGTRDLGLSRIGAGVVAVGNGTQGDVTGTIQAATVIHTPMSVGALPAPNMGRIACVSDGDAGISWGAQVTTGGSSNTFYIVAGNGSQWNVIGK